MGASVLLSSFDLGASSFTDAVFEVSTDLFVELFESVLVLEEAFYFSTVFLVSSFSSKIED